MVLLTFHKHLRNLDVVFSWAHLQLITDSKLQRLLTKQKTKLIIWQALISYLKWVIPKYQLKVFLSVGDSLYLKGQIKKKKKKIAKSYCVDKLKYFSIKIFNKIKAIQRSSSRQLQYWKLYIHMNKKFLWEFFIPMNIHLCHCDNNNNKIFIYFNILKNIKKYKIKTRWSF